MRSRPALPGADHFPRAAVRGWGCEGLMFSFLNGGSTFLTDSPNLSLQARFKRIDFFFFSLKSLLSLMLSFGL